MAAETQEERVARLTSVARKVWPYEGDVRVFSDERDGEACVFEEGGDDCLMDTLMRVIPQSSAQRDRALDALEAALCALAQEPPRWVSELAERWRDAESSADAMQGNPKNGWQCADELLEAAKRGGNV